VAVDTDRLPHHLPFPRSEREEESLVSQAVQRASRRGTRKSREILP
jgi:hypothetical protein